MRKLIFALPIFCFLISILLAEPINDAGLYVVNGWRKPCTIRQWSQSEDLSLDASNGLLVDESFFLKRMRGVKRSISAAKKESSNIPTNVSKKSEVSALDRSVNSSLSKDQCLLSSDFGFVDADTKRINERFVSVFNELINDFFDKKPPLLSWAEDVNIAFAGESSKIGASESLTSQALSILRKLFPENPDFANIIFNGNLAFYDMAVDEINKKRQALHGKVEFQAWAEEYFVYIQNSSDFCFASKRVLKKMIQDIIASK